MSRQTYPIDAHVPVCSERSTDAEEQEDAHGGKSSNARHESVHASIHMLGVYDPEEKQTDGDLHKRQSDECLDPVGPADDYEESSLRRRQVVLVSSQAIDNLGRDHSGAEHGRHLVRDPLMNVHREEGFSRPRERVLTMAATAT